MRKFKISLSFMFCLVLLGFSECVFGQSDSLIKPLQSNSKSVKVENALVNSRISDTGNFYQRPNLLSRQKIADDSVVLLRNQLISHFRKGEIEEVRKIKDLLLQNQESEGEFLSFSEYWLILYWTKEYDSLLVSIKNWKDDSKIKSRFHSIYFELKIKSIEFRDSINSNIEFATNGNDRELLKAKLNQLLFTNAEVGYQSFSIEAANKNNFEENPKQMIRLQVLLLPGLFYEKLIFRNFTIQPGAGLGILSYEPDNSNKRETVLTCKLTLEARIYNDENFWYQKDDWCGFFAGKFEQEIPLNNHEPSQYYTIYYGGTGSIYKRVYGLIGIGVGLVTTPDGTYPSFDIPFGVGIRLSNK